MSDPDAKKPEDTIAQDLDLSSEDSADSEHGTSKLPEMESEEDSTEAGPDNPETEEFPVDETEDATSDELLETTEEHHIDDHADEDEGPGLASRALVILASILIGGGLALWAAPKIAPSLPSGLAPVAEWLTPGSGAANERVTALEGELARLRADLETRIANLPAPVDEAQVAALMDSRITAATGSTAERIGGLQTRLDALADLDMDTRLAALERQTGALKAQSELILSQLSAVSEEGAGLSSQTAAQIDSYQTTLEGLRAELAAMAAQYAALNKRLDSVAATASEQMAEAETKVTEAAEAARQVEARAIATTALGALDLALENGSDFSDELDNVAKTTSLQIPDGLAANAGGVARLVDLQDSFADGAHAAIRAGILAAAGDSTLARARAFAAAQIATRSLTPQQGLTPDAILSRSEDALRRGDLDTALEELTALPPEASAEMAGWIAKATARRDALAGYAELQTALGAE